MTTGYIVKYINMNSADTHISKYPCLTIETNSKVLFDNQ